MEVSVRAVLARGVAVRAPRMRARDGPVPSSDQGGGATLAAGAAACLTTGAPLALGILKTHTMPPCSSMLTFLATSPPHSGTAPPQPDTTLTYCSPPCCQVTGGATTPEPVWNCHSTLPVLASAAFSKPSGVPQNTRLPPVVNTPPHSGALFFTSQTILPLFGSIARSAPM